jgi:hypothetical protein
MYSRDYLEEYLKALPDLNKSYDNDNFLQVSLESKLMPGFNFSRVQTTAHQIIHTYIHTTHALSPKG